MDSSIHGVSADVATALADSLPVAVWQGTFTLYGVPLRCSVLDNGMRVIDSGDVMALLEAMASDAPPPANADEIKRFALWRAGR